MSKRAYNYLLALAVGLSLGNTLASELAVVVAKDYGFDPPEITIKAGTTVRWENHEKRQYHSVFFEQLGDKPGDYFFPGETRERTFDNPGPRLEVVA